MHLHTFITPHLPLRRPRPSCTTTCPSMSGVNGGIDYEIDLSLLPSTVATRVRYVQAGPDSPTELISAARAIAAAAPAHPATLPVLVDMLGFNNPVAANVAVDALSAAGPAAVAPLLSGVAAFNYAVNAYALRALGRIGDPSVIDVCIQCAEKGPIPNVRRAACRALAGLRLEGEDAALAHRLLVELVEGEADWGVRYAAIVGVECFTATEELPVGERERGVRVLEAVARGGDGDMAVDPTVAARATVALSVLQKSAVSAGS